MMRPPVPSKRWSAAFLVVLLTISMLPIPAASAGTTIVMGAHLPSARDGTSAVATPDAIYIFGGDAGSSRSDQILRYDVRNDTLSVMDAKLPSPRSGTSAVYDGQYAYVFGGWGSPYSDQIVRYDPATDTVSVLPETLPSARIYTSAVWTGQHVYIFGGGVSSASTTDEIVRYDPATGSVTTSPAKLPSPRYGTSAIWDGQYAYVIGGVTLSTGVKHDQIVRYDPATDSVTVLGAKLPTPRYHTSAVYAAGQAHIFGGYDCSAGISCDTIVNVDLASGTVSTNSTVLTTERYLTSAAYYGRYAYIIAGLDGTRKDQILRHGPIEPNRAPVLDGLTDLVHQATLDLTLNVTATDADNDFLTLTAPVLPSGAAFTDHGGGSGTLTWTPTRAQTGLHDVRIEVDDGTDTTGQDLTINVTEGPDRVPVFDPIDDQNALAGELLTVPVSATDPDGDAIAFSATGPTGVGLTDHGDGTATFEWTPTAQQTGTHGITITASASGNGSSESFNVTVSLPPNRPPVIDPVDDLETYFGDFLWLNFSASDPDGDPITFSLDPIPSNATFTDNGDGTATLQWGIDPSHQGIHNLTLGATDGNATSNESFEVQVFSGPPPYIVPIDDKTVTEGDPVLVLVAGDDGNPDQELTVTLTIGPLPLPGNATFTDEGNGTGTFEWWTGFTDAGVYTFTVTADNGDRTASESFTVTVLDLDRAPVFTAGNATFKIGVGKDLSVQVSAHDPDGTTVTLTTGPLPTGATFVDNGGGSGTLTWLQAEPVGLHTIDLGASSAGKTTSGVMTIEVLKEYDRSVVQVGPTRIDASPHEVVELTVRIKNTGALDDNYSISANDASQPPEGWPFSHASSVFVPAGETRIVTVNTTVPAGGTFAKPRVVVNSLDSPGTPNQLFWLVFVPVKIAIIPVDPQPSIVEGEALILFNGTVKLTWNNGLPAKNMSFTYRHVMNSEPLVLHQGGAQVNETGRWAFGGMEHPFMGLPNINHHLYVDVPYGRFTYSNVNSWQIGPPWL